uniref:Nanos-type domain-containing protein n=1 Tax=Chelydra serpentina TaxID=8475 RepID=A0A8C3SP09_CHESE
MLPAWLFGPPSPPVAIMHDFNMWRDYLNLSKVLGEIIEEHRQESGSLRTCETAALCLPETPLPMSPGDASSPNKPICSFCRHNGESRQVYSSHLLKQADGTVVCPILRSYVCPVCGATGDEAHTLKYCPGNQGKRSLFCKGRRNSAGFIVRR